MKHSVCVYRHNAEALAEGTASEIALELQSFGMKGIASKDTWHELASFYIRFVEDRPERVYHLHGPFMSFTYFTYDHVFREAVESRLGQTLDLCRAIRPVHLILHLCCPFGFTRGPMLARWIEGASEFLRPWLDAFARLDVTVVFENVWEPDPSPALRLYDRLGHDHFGICIDVGHSEAFSETPPSDWVLELGPRIRHFHIHDNAGDDDSHWPPGKGAVDFPSLYGAIRQHCPDTVLSIEVEAPVADILESLDYSRKLARG